jgi:cytochrome c oxidase cbb3-type subunit 4
MTGTDWFGLVLTVVVFLVLLVAYVWTLNPKNKESIESHRTMLLDENDTESEK